MRSTRVVSLNSRHLTLARSFLLVWRNCLRSVRISGIFALAGAAVSLTPAGIVHASAAIPECTPAAVSAVAPAGMVIRDIPDLDRVDGISASADRMPATVQGVVAVPKGSLGAGSPEFCVVTGTVITNPRTGKTANFAAALPVKAAWNGKFMFRGCGGNCGNVSLRGLLPELRKGFPVFATDDGHVAKAPPAARLWANSESSWATSAPGKRNDDAVTDFFYRAVHAVVAAGKSLTQKYYAAARLRYDYFEGCSDGGREGMVEIARYPSDFDGVIVGDPYFDVGGEIANSIAGIQVQLRTPKAMLSHEQLAEIDRIVSAKCDAADGVSDGLIQNPARCDFDPQADLPKCSVAKGGGNLCFTQDQIDSVTAILSAITDTSGHVVYPGYPVGNFTGGGAYTDNLAYWLGFNSPPDSLKGPEPWTSQPGTQPQAWYWSNQTLRYVIYADEPGFNGLSTPGITFRAHDGGPIEGFHAVIPAQTLARLQQNSAAGDGDVPADSTEFFREGRKLIVYDGYSDGDITPFRTVQYYRALARIHGGYKALQRNARLFMVPGMAHCGGGPGPNSFGQLWAPSGSSAENDIVAAMEDWVEKGRTPKSIIATKFEQDDPSRPVVRTMPLCPFPAMARYKGSGDVKAAANWSCPADDERLLKIGRAGREAGVGALLNIPGSTGERTTQEGTAYAAANRFQTQRHTTWSTGR